MSDSPDDLYRRHMGADNGMTQWDRESAWPPNPLSDWLPRTAAEWYVIAVILAAVLAVVFKSN